MFRSVEQRVHLLLMADHPAPTDAGSASFLMLHFPSALGSSIHGDLLTGELTEKCHFCKPDMEKHEKAISLSVCFVWTPPELAFIVLTELVAVSPVLSRF